MPYNGHGYPWPDYVEGMRLYSRDLVLGGMPPAEVRAILDQAAVVQAEWYRRHLKD